MPTGDLSKQIDNLKALQSALESNLPTGIFKITSELDTLQSSINKSFGLGRELSREIKTTITRSEEHTSELQSH